MNKTTQKAYDATLDTLNEAATKLGRGDYKQLLDELQSHIQCLIDCWNEEEEAGQ